MIEKNKIYRTEVVDVNNFGDGIAKIYGEVVFVKGGVTGDIIDAKIIKTAKNYAVGMICELVQASPYRCDNDCHVYKRCGGCVSRHIAYEYELKLKRGFAASALKRAGLSDITVHETASTYKTDCYRNKAQYVVAADKKTGKLKIGFYADHTHDVADSDGCKLAPQIFTDIVESVRIFAQENKLTAYDETTGKGLLRHIYLRHAEMSGEVLLCLVINENKFELADKFASYITDKHQSVVGVLLNINKKNTNVILSDEYVLVYGRDYITDTLCSRKFNISKSAFYQVNRNSAELLYNKAKELAALKEGDVLVDLYCGVGTVGMCIADTSTELYGVEIVPEAIENAKVNARLNGFENAHFFASDAADFTKYINLNENTRDLVVVIDPPRKGLAPSVVADIAKNAPTRVVYISCNPDTLARDIVEFRKYGYDTNDVYPYDLFPRTGHVECICILNKSDS